MTPEQVHTVRTGIEQLRPRLPAVADAFYVTLFARHPELRPMFPADLTKLRGKFADELRTVVRALADVPGFVEQARQLGTRHTGYGVRVGHYALARAALLDTLAAELGSQWTEETALAWQAAYDMLTEAMQLRTH